MSNFLPKNYKAPTSSGNFMKFQDGANRFRILSEAQIGWEGWKDGKPFRRQGIEQNINASEVDSDSKFGKPKPKISHFWAFLAYDYADKKVKILSITQKSVMKAIEDLNNDADWGDPQSYDLTVTKTKKGAKTNYSVISSPPKPIAPEVKEAFDANEIKPEELFAPRDEEDEELDNYNKK